MIRSITQFVLALLLLLPCAAHAASPEQDYLAARDAAIARLAAAHKRGVPVAELDARNARALADLEKRLRAVVGPIDIKGFAAPGKIHLQALTKGDMEFGMLDGLAYASPDETTRVVVTTEGLLKSWLRQHRNWWPGLENVPQDVAAAMRSDAFYTQAIGTGAAFGRFAEIPVTKPAQASVATAALAAQAQDIGPRTPTDLLISLVRDGRVFVVSAPAAAEIPPTPECDAIWQAVREKADEADEAYRQSRLKDPNVLDRQRRTLEDEGDAAYRRCYAERVVRHPDFAKLVAQAKDIVARLAEK